MRRVFAVIGLSFAFAVVGATVASADRTPNSPGQPGQSCQSFSATTRPGNSYLSPGSPFNEPMINSVNGGTGGNAYNAAGANAQYDVACFQAAQHQH